MSEPKIDKPPKPYSKTSYVFLTTLWAFLLPGAIVHILPAAAAILPMALALELERGIVGLCVCIVGFVICILLLHHGMRFWTRLEENLRTGQIPGSFFLWILPIWLPLFWGLVVTAVGFYAGWILFDYSVSAKIMVLGFPQYFFFGYALAFDSFFKIESVATFFCVVTFIVTIIGTTHVARIAPPTPKVRGLVLCFVIALLLWGLVSLSYSYFRSEIVYPFFGYRPINDRNLYGSGSLWESGSDTDLSEYIPFYEGNKLVKVESPTLAIDSDHPRIHGAFAFYPIYAAAVEATYRNAKQFKFYEPSYYYDGLAMMSGTSPAAFESLLGDGPFKSDMIFMLQPSDKQLQEAADKGVELVITPIGYEAFVFFVSTVNPVDDLTLDQIRDIYAKKITRWNDIGGKNERILPFQRPEGSGSQTAMLRMMGDVPIAPPLPREFRKGMGGIVESVADYRNYGNSIGFSFRYYVESLYKHEGVKMLKVNGVAPTVENIQNGTYPLISELVIISRADNTNPNVPKLTEWFLSPQGQGLVCDVGYVPMEINDEH